MAALNEHDNALRLSAASGLLAIVALPITATVGPASAVALMFATPLMLLSLARVYQRHWLTLAGRVLLVLLLPIGALTVAGVSVGLFGLIPIIVLFAGPVLGAAGVGMPLRQRDLLAAGAYLFSATVAVVAGFLAAATPLAPVMIMAVATTGFVIVSQRLKTPKTPSDA